MEDENPTKKHKESEGLQFHEMELDDRILKVRQ